MGRNPQNIYRPIKTKRVRHTNSQASGSPIEFVEDEKINKHLTI